MKCTFRHSGKARPLNLITLIILIFTHCSDSSSHFDAQKQKNTHKLLSKKPEILPPCHVAIASDHNHHLNFLLAKADNSIKALARTTRTNVEHWNALVVVQTRLTDHGVN